MALTDINYNSGEGQAFLVELPVGSGTTRPNDIMVEPSTALLCVETPLIVAGTGGGGNIFIISD